MLEFAQILFFLCWNDQEIFSYVVICVYWFTYVEPFPACLEWSQLDHSEWFFWCNLEFAFQATCSEFLPLYSSGNTVIFPFVLFLSGLGTRLIMSSLKTLEAFLPFLFCGTIWTVLLSALLRVLQVGFCSEAVSGHGKLFSWEIYFYYFYCFNQIVDHSFFWKNYLFYLYLILTGYVHLEIHWIFFLDFPI